VNSVFKSNCYYYWNMTLHKPKQSFGVPVKWQTLVVVQQSVASPGHIILIPSQSVFALSP
jgi:hypothetical protein